MDTVCYHLYVKSEKQIYIKKTDSQIKKTGGTSGEREWGRTRQGMGLRGINNYV